MIIIKTISRISSVSLISSEPATIHLAGEKLHQEQLQAIRSDTEMWKSRIVVDDIRTNFHRCATDTEMTIKGPRSSNQIDRLRGMLKDSPNKYSLKKQGRLLCRSAQLVL